MSLSILVDQASRDTDTRTIQRSKRPIDWGSRRRQEDYETLQHPRPVQANVSRIETLEASAP